MEVITIDKVTEIQDKMRNACIKSYNKFYEVNTRLKQIKISMLMKWVIIEKSKNN